MRRLKFIVFLIIPIFFTGCLEINEEISVEKNGSGKYGMKIDMGQLVEMLKAFMPAEELEKADLQTPKDTTVLLKDYIDTASALSADKKALLRDGSIHLNMNMPEKIFKIDMQYPFASLASLQKLYVSMGESTAGMADMLKGLNGPSAPDGEREPPNLNKIASYFDLVTTNNSVSRKLNKDKYAAMAGDSMMEQLKNMSAMGGGMIELKMNMKLALPAPVKKITGVKAISSADKKTVTIQNNMLDIFDHPENFEFSVEY